MAPQWDPKKIKNESVVTGCLIIIADQLLDLIKSWQRTWAPCMVYIPDYLGMFWLTWRLDISASFMTTLTGVLVGF